MLQLATNLRVMPCLEGSPATVAELDCDLARTRDVGEQQADRPALVSTPAHHRWSLRWSPQPFNC
jgi:hypothetical protein